MLYVTRTDRGIFTTHRPRGPWNLRRHADWDSIFRTADPIAYLEGVPPAEAVPHDSIGTPVSMVSSQEVWAAGVTYFRSRTARMEESRDGGSFYDKVYEAERPELFFKGNRRTVVASGEAVRIRADSAWNVPEPELVLLVNAHGSIVGYTAGNDMSSRDIEGENPLYLPQAKVYDGSCAIGPTLVLTSDPIDRSLAIRLEISRGGARVFNGDTTLEELKRSPEELVGYLVRDQRFPDGCMLMTGTGVVPDDSFTLEPGDVVRITLGDLAPLVNTVAQEKK
jgi:2-dehydro-3-deoxy-D-arabinonate dehydratase